MNRPPRPWLLVTEGGRGLSRAAVAVVRGAAASGYAPAVTESDGFSLAGASRFCARRVPVPLASRDPHGYAAAVRRELATHRYLAVIPCGEDALGALGIAPARLTDKLSCLEAARSVGIAVPPTKAFASAAHFYESKHDLAYPLIVKPTNKRYTAIRALRESELPLTLPDDGPVLVQPYLDSPMRGVLGAMWRGHLIGAVHLRYLRLWPLPCGTVAAAETTPPDVELEERLEALLAPHEGLFHVDLAGRYLLDVNLRAHATLPLAAAAGADLVRSYCEAVLSERPAFVRGRAGVFFRWIEGDVRSLFRAVRERRLSATDAAQALLPRRGEVHGYEALSDPGPLLARIRYALGRARRAPKTPAPSIQSA